MLNVCSKGRRKCYDCFAIEVRLKNRTLNFGATEVHSHIANVKEYPPPRVSAQPRAIEFLWQKFSAFFSSTISLRKFPSSPQTKIWLFVTVPFSTVARNVLGPSKVPLFFYHFDSYMIDTYNACGSILYSSSQTLAVLIKSAILVDPARLARRPLSLPFRFDSYKCRSTLITVEVKKKEVLLMALTSHRTFPLCYDDIYDDTSAKRCTSVLQSDKQTCGHDLIGEKSKG